MAQLRSFGLSALLLVDICEFNSNGRKILLELVVSRAVILERFPAYASCQLQPSHRSFPLSEAGKIASKVEGSFVSELHRVLTRQADPGEGVGWNLARCQNEARKRRQKVGQIFARL